MCTMIVNASLSISTQRQRIGAEEKADSLHSRILLNAAWNIWPRFEFGILYFKRKHRC